MTSPSDIAIVGMAIRCPGAANLSGFWDNLVEGRESITFFSPEELEQSLFLPVDSHDPNFVPAAGIVENHDLFDAEFFGISRAEAEGMDPQHRLFLQCVWEAMEDSGHDLTRHPGNVAVYAGSASNTYMLSLVANGNDSPLRSYQGLLGTEKDYLSTRISYLLDLSGESMTVQTACSTSLVAVHLACQSLLTGQSEVAIAGGVSVQANQKTGYIYNDDAIFSADGRCRAFDADAGGTVFSNGMGAVVLKPLATAVDDGDRIYAVIKGTAVNNDGRAKMSYTAPSVSAQAAVVADALEFADVSADSIDYVETHGTATVLGDPVEIEALTQAYRRDTPRIQYCSVGSVKTNIGHLNTAAGIAGLIKTALSLHHGMIPPSLNFQRPNPRIDFASSPFFVNDKLRRWPEKSSPRRAGVSSFGIGGTNAHAILEQAPAPDSARRGRDRARHILAISARDQSRLRELASEHLERLATVSDADLADYCFTANAGRAHYDNRLAVHARNGEELCGELRRHTATDTLDDRSRPIGPIAFVFGGQVGEFEQLGHQLYRSAPTFTTAIQDCEKILGGRWRRPLHEYLNPTRAAELSDTRIAQPVQFAVQYALARLWQSWGVTPSAVVGYSLGEYVAACLAGVLTLDDALMLVCARAELVAELAEGAMAAVFAPRARVERYLAGSADRVSVAADNGPAQTVLAGEPDAVEAVLRVLEADDIEVRPLSTRYGFHSHLVEPALPEFEAILHGSAFASPAIRFVSTVTGEEIRAPERTDATHWIRQLREPVLFHPALTKLQQAGFTTFLEIAHPTGLPKDTATGSGARTWITSLRSGEAAWDSMLSALAEFYTAGVEIDWQAFDRDQRRIRVSVPGYPFAGERHWLRPLANTPFSDVAALADQHTSTTLVGTQPAAGPIDAGDSLDDHLRRIVASVTGADLRAIDADAPLATQGLDSLSLIEAATRVRREFGIKVTVRALLTEIRTVSALGAYIREHGSTVAMPAAPPPPRETPPTAPVEQLSDFVPHRPVTVRHTDVDDPARRRELSALVERYNLRTLKSKYYAGKHKRSHADNDNRFIPEFRMESKEITYPIVIDRSSGCRVHDCDGNEYIDFIMGMGVNLFGHSPEFVTTAVRDQLDKGIHLGTSGDLAGKVADALCELTGHERVVFCNTGTEAVMTALRLARAATGRSKVALFAGSYHGVFDGTLVRRAGDLTAPLAPGVPPHIVDDIVVVDYGQPESLAVLAEHADDLAAVLVEPVQSRRPDFAPWEFLHELRRFTEQVGAALVFDEIVTGFRCAPGGAQELFGVRTDVTVYGKVLGGGLPIGAVAGSRRFIDAIDGGYWGYGDDSYPTVDTTFFAGTFCKHPLAMVAANAVLNELASRGPQLQERLNLRTERFVTDLSACFTEHGLAVTIPRFGSQFRLVSSDDIHLLYPLLIENGLYIREGRNLFLSDAHTDEDLARALEAVRKALATGRRSGLLPGGRINATASNEPPARNDLTPGQHQVWTLAKMDPASASAYNQVAVLDMRGLLRLDALEQAINHVVRVHDSLRTTFGEIDPVQRVLSDIVVPLRTIDATGDLTDSIADEGATTFDLTRGPMLRAAVLRRGDSEHVLVVSSHHIVADGWSMGVLLQHIALCYSAICRGESLATGRVSQFEDYRRRLESIDSAERVQAEHYWLRRFDGPVPTLDLPGDKTRPVVRSFRGARTSRSIDVELAARIDNVARTHDLTSFSLLLAVYTMLLHRLSDQDDVIVGIPAAARLTAEDTMVIGPCANMLPIRSRVNRELSFSEHLVHIGASVLEALEFQHYPFQALLERLELPLDPSRTPLVSSVFNVDRQVAVPQLADLEVDRITFPVRNVQFDLLLNIVPDHTGLRMEMDYSSDLFDEATPTAWLELYVDLLRAVIAAPDQPLHRLYRSVVTSGVNGPEHEDTMPARCLPDLFEDRARRTPDRVCVRSGDSVITYRQLAHRSDRLAAALQRCGVGPEVVVAVIFAPSISAHVAILGILKAGGAYLPLDPSLPYERLSMLLEMSGALHVIESTATAGKVAITTDTDRRVFRLDADGDLLGPFASDSAPIRDARLRPENAAYIMYTSGSTGVPKAVVGTHHSTVNRLRWMWREFSFASGETMCQKTSLAFVDSVWELFGPLLAGVCTVVVDRETVAAPDSFVRLLAAQEVTRVVVVPTLLSLMLDALDAHSASLPSLRHWTVSGEELPATLVHRFRHHFPEATLLNLYGCTEVSADATAYSSFAEIDRRRRSPIGGPIDNSAVYLLDPRLDPVPVGAIGELYVSGATVNRGYADRPDLTGSRFVADPFAERPGQRMYRTGDRARRAPGEVFEFVGRADRQVKIRGVRVELGEVEAALNGHPAVVNCAVITETDWSGSRTLTGYIELRPDVPTIDVFEIRRYLTRRLPEQFVPTEIVTASPLPRTSSGKIDRRSLARTNQPSVPDRGAEQALTATERTLLELWSGLLPNVPFESSANFFDLGANSLHAIRLRQRIVDRFGIPVTAHELFAAPTVSDMAAVIEDKLIADADDETVDSILRELESLDEYEVSSRPTGDVNTPPDSDTTMSGGR